MAIKYGSTGLHDSSDDTKIVAFDASGITTSTTRTVTVPDGNVDLTGIGSDLKIDSSGNVGIGETAPETVVEISSTAPYLTLHNTTHEDTDGGRESRIIFKGERANGTETTIGQIQCSHGGTGNDYEGEMIFSVNTHTVDADSLTEIMRFNEGGNVTKPSQPCVSARAAGTDIPINTVTVITLDNERFDVGNNLASSTFTAPVTGKYLYTYTLYFTNVDTAATSLGVQVVTSNRQYENWFSPDHIANSDFYYTATSSQIADMDANDTLQFKAYCGGGSTQTDVHADSQISIILLA